MKKFDESIFTINKNFSAKVTEIGLHKNRLFEVEGLFKYPERVREFLDDLPIEDVFTKNKSTNVIRSFYPGYQTFLRYELKELEKFFTEACEDVFNFRLQNGLAYAYQCIDGNKPVYKQSCLPHSDPLSIAANIFLNYEDEIGERSGTSFYRSKHTKNEFRPPIKCGYRIKRDYGNKEQDLNITRYAPILHNDDWEEYHHSPQKFNKLNMYEGALYHAAFIKFNTFTKCPRISLTIGDK